MSAFIAGNAMIVTLAVNLSETRPTERRAIHLGLAIAAVAVATLLGPDLARGIAAAVRRRQLTIEFLFLLSAAGAAVYSAASALRGTGAVYFETVAIVLVIYALGCRVKGRAQTRLAEALSGWTPKQQTCRFVLVDGPDEVRPVADVRVGDFVRVFPDELVPIDGRVAQGRAFVREATLTGEPVEVSRGPGDAVSAGTHCCDGTLLVEATAPGDRRKLDELLAALRAAGERPSRYEREADRLAAWFVPAVATAAGVTLLGWGLAAGWGTGLTHAMAVLLVACPCAAGFATSLAVWTGKLALADRGLTVRRGEAIERLASVDLAVFDKTGTLTSASPTLVRFDAAEGAALPVSETRAAVAAVERESRHPLAGPLAAADPGRWSVDSVRVLPGVGVEAEVRPEPGGSPLTLKLASAGGADGCCCRCGTEEGNDLRHRISVELDGRPAALAVLDERPRDGLSLVAARLAESGVETRVMSGDRAERVARLGLSGEGGLSPSRKAERVAALVDSGRRVLYVGDGINDSAAIAAATCGVAVAGGSALACAAADLHWSGGDLAAVPQGVEIARRVVGVLRSNLRYAVAYNAAGISAAAAGLLHPALAAVLMLGSSLFVTYRAGRVLD